MSILIQRGETFSEDILRLFEKTRVAFLSANADPREYSSKWEKAIEEIKDKRELQNNLGKEIRSYVEEDILENNDTKNPQSKNAEQIYQAIKLMRYASDEVEDPFAKRFKGEVLENLIESPENMVKFLHYAIRSDKKALPDDIYSIKDMKGDDITDGLVGLDLEVKDIPLYIIEHYGDGKDSKMVERKVKAAMSILELLFMSKNKEKDWNELKDIEMKKSERKADTEFIIPNKPMYRIFDIEDLEELKGFSGEYIIQEKYDGLRIQLHKIDDKVNIFDFEGNDITSKCPEQVSEIKKKHFGDCILDGSLILFSEKDEPMGRAATIDYLKNKKEGLELKAHMFDVLRHNEKMLTEEPMKERISIIFNNYSIHSSDKLSFPSKKDTRNADSMKDIDEYSKAIMDMETSEGVVIKDAESTYFRTSKKNPKWIKWKKMIDLDLIVLDKKSKKYILGAGPYEGDGFVEFQDGKYMEVGSVKANMNASAGDIVRVEVNSVKEKNGKFTVTATEIIEIPETKNPDKIVTLEILSKKTKERMNYKVENLEKGISITDHIHGEASFILKSNMDGFTIYAFEKDNLMSKNAAADLEMWKQEAEEIMKTKQSKLTVAAFNYLKQSGPQTIKELHKHLIKNHKDLYEDILESKVGELKDWMRQRDGISYDVKEKKLMADDDKILMDRDSIIKYKTPKKYRSGKFKVYLRDDENINFLIKLGDETLSWLIKLEKDDDIFDLFGKAGKYPAEVATSIDRKRVIDEGDIELGVQKQGYHEYFLKGNKFETKMHFRVLPVKDERTWLAWTGYKQKPADKEEDEGLWDITEDKFSKLKSID